MTKGTFHAGDVLDEATAVSQPDCREERLRLLIEVELAYPT
jgi:hypothetical protein